MVTQIVDFTNVLDFISEGDVFSFCRVLKRKLMKLYLYSTMKKLTKLPEQCSEKSQSVVSGKKQKER